MRILIYNIAFLLFLVACKGNKEIIKSINGNSKHSYEIIPAQKETRISPNTKIFLLELEKEKLNQKEYQPSQTLIDNYNLLFIDNEFFICGFIKVDDNFNKEDLEKINTRVISTSGSIITVHIPLSSIDNFLKINSVKYFQISEKAELKK